jgi:NAD-dependent dihydropyrimidine dehydrogenase PreA subunit
MKHGANGRWYLNAKNYLQETYDEAGAVDYLTELWSKLERMYVNKTYRIMNIKTVSEKLHVPILGRLLKGFANWGMRKEKHLNLNAAQGHYGCVVPLDESKMIVQEIASDTIIQAVCPCKHFAAGIKEATCLGFTPLAEVLPKIPRLIPETGLKVLDGDQAASLLEKWSDDGFVHTIWCGPRPSIAAICSCKARTCGGLRLKVDFDINACHKGEYVAVLNKDRCIGCGKCASRCQFGALSYTESDSQPVITPEACYGCALCHDVCEESAIQLVDRNLIPETRGML